MNFWRNVLGRLSGEDLEEPGGLLKGNRWFSSGNDPGMRPAPMTWNYRHLGRFPPSLRSESRWSTLIYQRPSVQDILSPDTDGEWWEDVQWLSFVAHIDMVFGSCIELVHWIYGPTYSWGHHLADLKRCETEITHVGSFGHTWYNKQQRNELPLYFS